MNCSQKDLAMVVRSTAGNEGKILKCLLFIGAVPGFYGDDYWLTDLEVVANDGRRNRYYRDSWLRPIRDPGDDAVDETLLRLPSPRQEVTA